MANKVEVGLVGRDKGATSTLAKVRKGLVDLRSTAKTLTAPFRAAERAIFSLKGVVVALATASAVRGLGKLVEQVDAIGKLAQATGDSVQDLSALRVAFDLAGVGADQLKVTVKALGAAVADAIRGEQLKASAFAQLGLEVDELRRLGTVELLDRIAEGLSKLDRGTAQSTLKNLFPDQFQALAPLIGGGSEAFRELIQMSKDAGGIFDPKDAAVAAQIQDELALIKATFEGLLFDVIRQFGPAIRDLIHDVRNALPSIRDYVAEVIEAWKYWTLVLNIRQASGLADLNVELEAVGERIRLNNIELERLAKGGFGGSPAYRDVLARNEPLLEQLREIERRIKAIKNQQAEADRADALARERAGRPLFTEDELSYQPPPKFSKEAVLRELRLAELKAQPQTREVRVELETIGADTQIEALERRFHEAGFSVDEFQEKIQELQRLLDRAKRRTGGDFFIGFADAARQTADEWSDMTATGAQAFGIVRGLAEDSADAIATAFLDSSASSGDAIRAFVRQAIADLVRLATTRAILNVASLGLGSLVPAAEGRAFGRGGEVIPMANGGILRQTTAFPIRNGLAIGGELHDEAVMPLKRVGGKLGVYAAGAGGRQGDVNLYITAPDGAEWFRQNAGLVRSMLVRFVRDEASVRGSIAQSVGG